MDNQITLPLCKVCGTIQYPPREICCNCLSDQIERENVNTSGRLLSKVVITHSLEEIFNCPSGWPIATVKLENGTSIITHLFDENTKIGNQILLQKIVDPAGRDVIIAKPIDADVLTWNDLQKVRNK